jgi:FlaA1/EpsC-like NDP-sugar epimerase
MKIIDVAKAINPQAKLKVIGIRPGEKIHEEMISLEDSMYTYEYDSHYKILPQIHEWSIDPMRIGIGKRCAENFRYSSGTNTEWMTVEQLQKWIDAEYGKK